MKGRMIPLSLLNSEFPIMNDHRGSPLGVASDGNAMPWLVDLEKVSRGNVAFPQQMSSSARYSNMGPYGVGMSAFGGTFSNPTSAVHWTGNSDWTRHGVPVQNNQTLSHVGSLSSIVDVAEPNRYRGLLLSNRVPEDNNALSRKAFNKPMINHKLISKCEAQALQSKQRHFKPPPPPPTGRRPLQAQTSRFSMAPKNSQQQGFRNFQATKPAKQVQHMHNILISYYNYMYKPMDASKSQHEFLDSLHWNVCREGICKCENHRLLVLHFDKCKDNCCSICGPVRLVCFSGKQNECFSGGVHYRDNAFPESQPTRKRMKMENTVQNDQWSLDAITNHHLKQQSSEGPINSGESLLRSDCAFDDSIKTGNANPVLVRSDGISGVVEIQETGCVNTFEVKSYGEGSNYDDIWDLVDSDCQLGWKAEDLKQSASSQEIPSFNGSSNGEILLFNDDLFGDNTLATEIDASHCEEISTVVEMQETGCVVTCQVKECDESLNCDDKCDIAKSDCKSGRVSEDLKQTSLNKEIPCSISNIEESLLSSSCAFDDMNIRNENDFPYDEEIDKLVEEREMECVDTGRVISCGQSLNSDDKCDTDKSDCQSERNSEDLKVPGVSLIDFFKPEQIKEHLHSLNQRTVLSSGKGLAGGTYIHTVDQNTCQLCDVGGRTFGPLPMYCTCCGAQIKPGVNYYRPPEDGTSVKHSFCTSCFKVSRGGKGNISFGGLSFSKAKLEKCKHDDKVPEGWVQCDKCKGWQHQICALYNSKQDLEGNLEYVCPFCRLIEIEEKGHVSIRPAFGARDLPRTKLSDHIEERLFRSLEKERKRRAESLGKSPEEVPGAEDLVVRVVVAVNNHLKVKQEFLDILHGETFPTEFPYKSKVLLLFQKFEGVDVCIFAMYLQEFGSECGHPNNRSVYISYLDSVKYFRPEIKTVDGVSLRTFVYQEILIGYLDYCKQRGFASCYIFACPPIKGEDYILYCHPETQKTPNPHKLLQWYKKMLRKAKEESVVVEYTNFYDYFFVPSRECNSKITTARLPYFDGDYWSCAISNMIRTVEKETEGVSNRNMKTKTTKRALRAMGHSHLSNDKTKDMLVMQKLGQIILPSKEEFFVVHLHFTCVNCHEPILSGSRLSCNQCSKFHLCHRCIELGRTHTSIHGERHQLFEIRVNDVAADTEDEDIVLDNDLFNNRLSFLMFCQENHYQFDTLRRAKHSSMMILHHLQTNHTASL